MMRFLTTVIAICLFSSTALALSDGDTFTANSEEGIEVLYQVISETEKTVRVGKDATMSKAYETAVARDVTGQLTIPVTVNGYRVVELSIGAFYWRGGITEIVLPEGLERIENAFYQNGALRRMNIPSTVTFFEASFTGCNSLECIVVPDCVTEVWRAALAGAGFKSVTLPAGITSIGYEAFIYSNFLSGVFVNAVTPPVLDETAFQTTPYYNYYENTTIFVPEGSVSAYRAADGWSNFMEIRAPYTEGDVFTWTDKTGLEYEFIVTSAEEKTVQLGNGTRAAISAGYQGNINVPTYAKGYRVASIADNAFEGCSGISAVTASFDYPMDFSVSAFPASVYSNGCLYVPEDLRSRYAAKTGWNSFARVNPGDYALWDSFLAQTAEGVSMAFTVSDVNRKYVYCGDYRGNYFKDYQAIDSKTEGPVTIPDYVNGYKVTGIGYNAFNGCTKMTSVHMPESVTKIDKEGFSYCTSMASINLPVQLETIGKWAFWGCRSLSGQLSIPSGVTAIGEEAFAGCSSLSSIDVESGNPVYDSRDNSHSLIRTATNELVLGGSDAVIPSTVTAIGPSAFAGNKNITEINIPANVTSIGTSAYSGCSNAKRVVLNGTPAIAASAFKNLNDSCRVYVFSDVMPTLTEDAFSPKKTLCVPRSQRDGYLADAAWSQFERIRGMFPQGTEQFTVNTAEGDVLTIQITDPMMMTAQVGDGTHQALDNTSATSVTIPADAEDYDCQTIAANAFSNFPALKRVVVSNGINAIEGGAFRGTTLPDSIYCQAEAAYAIADNAFSDDIYNSSRLAVEPSLREAFAAQPGWRRFAHIGDPAIDLTGVTSLTAQTIEGVTLTFTVIDAETRTLRVGAPNDGAAAYWRTEGKITIPAEVMGCQVVEIGNKAFKSCSYLLAVTIPASVNSIGENAFGRNAVLIDVLKETPVDIPANAFTNYAGAKLHVPQGCKAAYQTAQYWKDFGFITDAEFISDDVDTFVCSNADGVPITYKLTDRLRLKVVVGDGEHAAVANGQSGVVCIPELANEMYSVEGISCNAFKDCTVLTGVVIPASIAAIDSAAFARCDALASVRCISPGVLDIGEHAFDEAIYSNATLQVYSFLTDTVATAPGWRNFKTVTDFMEPGIVFTTKTVEGVDMTCTTLDADSKTVMIGTVNGDNACNKNVKGKVSIPSEIGRCRVTAIGNNAFLYCMRLTETDIPESIESIGEAAFEDCDLQSVTIPAAVASIGKWAFSFNSSLKLVDVRRAEPAVLGYGAFYGVNATLHVPSGCAKAYRNANYWKDFEKITDGTIYPDSVDTFTCLTEDGVELTCKITDRLRLEAVVGDGESAAFSTPGTTAVTIPRYANDTYTIVGIATNAFKDCADMTSVVLPASVVSVDSAAFYECSQLGEVYLQAEKAYSTHPNAFDDNTYASATLCIYDTQQEAFAAAEGWKRFSHTKTRLAPASVIVAQTIEGVETSFVVTDAEAMTVAVGGRDGARAIDISTEGCITIPESVNGYRVTSLANKALYNCWHVTHVILPETIEKIDDEAFYACFYLEDITLPASLKAIGSYVFAADSRLKYVRMLSDTPPTDVSENTYYNDKLTLCVPYSCKTAYAQAAYWNAFGKIVEMGDVNGDGDIDIADAVCIVNHIVGKPNTTFVEATADVDGDGTVDIADAVRIVNLVVGKISALAREFQFSLPEPQ